MTSQIIKLIGDESRLTLLTALTLGPLSVSDLIEKIHLSQSLISHHLKDLKDGGLVKGIKDGRFVYYELTNFGNKIASTFSNSSSLLIKTAGETSRLKILSFLQSGTHLVSEIVAATNLSQSLVSHHLKDLRDTRLVEGQKNGRFVYYSLESEGKGMVSAMEGGII